MLRKQNDNILIGLMIGATVPVIGHWCIENIFTILTESGIMDEVSVSTIGKRTKTLTLLAICTNIIPAQLSSNKRYNKILQGVIFATLAYAAFWSLHFIFHII
jgi:hypothetical protein